MESDDLRLRVLSHLLGEDQPNYEDQLRKSYDSGLPQVVPRLVVLVLHENCNARCLYCPYVRDAVHFETRYAGTAQWQKTLDQIAAFGVRHVRFTGGEPTLRPDLVDLVEHATGLGLQSTIVTNGVRLTPELGAALLRAGLGALTISIDSFDREIFERIRNISLPKVLAGLDVAEKMYTQSRHFWVGVNCVVSNMNIASIPRMIEALSARGIPIQFMPVHSFAGDENIAFAPDLASMTTFVDTVKALKTSGRRINNSDAYLSGMVEFIRTGRLPDGFECSAGYLQVYIDPDLRLRPCCMAPPTCNLADMPLLDAWHSVELGEARKSIKNHKCPRCWLMYVDSWK